MPKHPSTSLALIAFLAGATASAEAATFVPQPLRNKTILVTWTDTRTQHALKPRPGAKNTEEVKIHWEYKVRISQLGATRSSATSRDLTNHGPVNEIAVGNAARIPVFGP